MPTYHQLIGKKKRFSVAVKIKIIANISRDFQNSAFENQEYFQNYIEKNFFGILTVNATTKTFSDENPQISPFLKIYSKSMRNKFPSI